MKVAQFINKFLYASSTIHEVYVCEGSKQTQLCPGEIADPISKEDRGNAALLTRTVQSLHAWLFQTEHGLSLPLCQWRLQFPPEQNAPYQ